MERLIMRRFGKCIAAMMTAVFLTGTMLSGTPLLAAEISGSEGVRRIMPQEEASREEIVSFQELSEAARTVRLANKPGLGQCLAKMPRTLTAVLADGSTEKIAVTWQCVGDYENSNYFYYQFNPVWDTDVYALNGGAEVPYINLFLGVDGRFKLATLEENREEIFNFMREKMGFNIAAACGVLANIQSESSFRPTASVIDTNGLTSYGLCQWNGPRFESLKTYCASNGYDYQTVEGQLYYLKYELEHSEASACARVRNVENTAEGAYQAGYNWARYFERCASVYFESRAKLARDTYWPMYNGSGGVRNKYSITYELDGGKNSEDNPKSYYNTSGTITLKDPMRTGYLFGGWFLDRKFKKQIKTISGADNTNYVLYAKWTEIRYNIAFHGNGAQSGQVKSLTNCEYDAIYTLPANKFARKGYRFAGWNTKKNGRGTAYGNKENVGNLTAKNGVTVTLYAQWKLQGYDITYVLNGGEQNAQNPDVYYANSKTIKLKNPKKNGYTFLGWYTDAKFKNKITKIAKGTQKNLKLYAKWQANQYKVVYDGNGATSGSVKAMAGCRYGKAYKVAINKFKRTNYTFAGWNTKKNGTGIAVADGSKFKNLTAKNNKTVRLYAQWNKITYKITYVLDGGTMLEENPSTYDAQTETFVLKEPVKTGYVFLGWYTEPSFTNRITQIKRGTKGNYTLYAKWDILRYTIAFDGNGASAGNVAAIGDCVYNSTYALPHNQFERPGYVFLGWNTAADGSGTFYQEGAIVKNLSGQHGATVTLYAMWDKVVSAGEGEPI